MNSSTSPNLPADQPSFPKTRLVLIGPTATGKTSLALKLARHFQAAILSVDSRQAYKDLNATTGKNLPDTAAYRPCLDFEDQHLGPVIDDGVEIWGYDFFDKDHEGSAGGFVARARAVEAWCKHRHIPLIYVGGSFNYLLSLCWPPATLDLKPDLILRNRLQYAPVAFLQYGLSSLDKTAVKRLNQSDWHNPTRLIRQIEILRATSIPKPINPEYDFVVVGLRPDWPGHRDRIAAHAKARFEGVLSELDQVESLPYLAATSLGYQQVRSFQNGECSKAEALSRWVAKEIAYAKRQEKELTRLPGVIWLSPSPTLEAEIVKLLETC